MTTEQINKAIREEAEVRYPQMNFGVKDLFPLGKRKAFIEGAQFILLLFENKVSETWLEEILLERTTQPSTNLEQQNQSERLFSEKDIKDAFNVGWNRLPDQWDGAPDFKFDNAEEYLNYINQEKELGLSIKPNANLEQQNTTQGLNNSEKLYRWVKADNGKLVYNTKLSIRVDGLPDIGLFYEETKACFCLNNGAIMEKDFHRIEWLEEINPQSSTELKAEEKIQELDSTDQITEQL